MKQSFEATKYYKNNKKFSKLHGVLFMLFGWIILGLIIYGVFVLSNNLNGLYKDWNSESSSSCSSYIPSYIASMNEEINKTNNKFESTKQEYEQLKIKYSGTSNIDQKVELFDQLGDNINKLIDTLNEAVTHYNNNIAYYEDCSDGSVSSRIEAIRTYIDQKEIEHDKEFEILKPKAEAEGYIFNG